MLGRTRCLKLIQPFHDVSGERTDVRRIERLCRKVALNVEVLEATSIVVGCVPVNGRS